MTDLKLAPATIAQIFDKKITKWNDPAIAADNPGATLPDLAITPVNRSDKSGTTQNFADYLKAAAPQAWSYDVSDTWPVQGGEAAQGTSGVVGAVKAGNGAIGYADESQAKDISQVQGQGGQRATSARLRRPPPRCSRPRPGSRARARACSPTSWPATPLPPAPTRWCWSPT